MPISEAGGTKIYYERTGHSGEPLVFVHGSWPDHHNWDMVVPELASDFQILTYDRRGHSLSERPEGQGTAEEDVSDLTALVKDQGWKSAYFVGNSFGGSIVLKLAVSRPDLFKGLSVHEPPLFGLLDPSVLEQLAFRVTMILNQIKSGDHRGAAWNFVENVAIGPGGWDTLAPEMREAMIFNAPTFLDEQQDPDWLTINLEALASLDHPVQLTQGNQSPPFFARIISTLEKTFKHARVEMIPGAGHIPQVTHAREYASLIRNWITSTAG